MATTTDRYIDPNSIVQDINADLDYDNPAALLDELTIIACGQGDHSIRGTSRADRIHLLGRVTHLVGRLVWLESTGLSREEREATLAEIDRLAAAQETAGRERAAWEAEAVASGEWVLLSGDRAVKADEYNPAVHGPRES